MPPSRFGGRCLARVDSGRLTLELFAGDVEVDSVDPDEQLRPGGTAVIVAGTRLWFGPDAVMA